MSFDSRRPTWTSAFVSYHPETAISLPPKADHAAPSGTADHARQEQVWEATQRSHSREPYHIRRMLTERTVRASDKRAVFVGLEAYEAAGGGVMRDLFQQDEEMLACSMAWSPRS